MCVCPSGVLVALGGVWERQSGVSGRSGRHVSVRSRSAEGPRRGSVLPEGCGGERERLRSRPPDGLLLPPQALLQSGPSWEKGAMHHSEAERYYREHCSVLFSMLKLVWLDSQSVRIRGHQSHSAAHRLSGGVHQEGHRYSHVLLCPLPSSGPRGPAEQRQSKNLLHTGTVDQIIMRLWGLGTSI